ncbi:MAG TPA: 30S ribosomal protein S6 [Candidatus Goldiibacteriota bacterium]|nr:30S ribosomal protein S6 [Candidatus Goldiibacteriota bacterium]
MKRPYEGIIFLKPSLSDAEIAAVIGKIKAILSDMKAEIIEEKTPEKKRLPYIVRKNREGFYYFLKFEVESASVTEIRHRIKILEEIIKLTIASAVPKPKEPVPATAKNEKQTEQPVAPAEQDEQARSDETEA